MPCHMPIAAADAAAIDYYFRCCIRFSLTMLPMMLFRLLMPRYADADADAA